MRGLNKKALFEEMDRYLDFMRTHGSGMPRHITLTPAQYQVAVRVLGRPMYRGVALKTLRA